MTLFLVGGMPSVAIIFFLFLHVFRLDDNERVEPWTFGAPLPYSLQR